jgi:DNA-binding response OmpR family regulator
MRVLLVEDEVALSRALVRGLRRNAMAVDAAYDGEEALRMAARHEYDVVVLDRHLPLVHGDEVCRRLVAARTQSRILMLTASTGLGDLVGGLDLGADDYVGKPVSLIELLARIRALGRRRGALAPPVLERSGLRLDPARRRAWRGDRELVLTLREFMLLEAFLRASGATLSAEQLLARVFDDAREEPTTAAVRVLLMRLRRKLGAPDPIETLPGMGYRLA